SRSASPTPASPRSTARRSPGELRGEGHRARSDHHAPGREGLWRALLVEVFELLFGQRARLRYGAGFVDDDRVLDQLAGLFVLDFDDVAGAGGWLEEIFIDTGHRDHLLQVT